ncbi:hypothetical protein HDU89_005038 [Geranomyces variabilis]|nr:hypothetical protein HDU89_005038 [Geranomyces variabilis]
MIDDNDETTILRFGGPNEPPIPPYTSSAASPLRHDRIVVLTFPLLPAAHDWTLQDADGVTRTPNYKVLAARYGDILVKAEKTAAGSGETVQETMLFAEFLDRVRSGEALYLRDWHLVRELRTRGEREEEEEEQRGFYDCPLWFCDDWLNGFLDRNGEDDYRFVYIGGPNTCTLLHCDVLHSYSWSANICGTKTWTFFPPSQTPHLSNARNEQITDIRTASTTQFPAFHSQTTPITLTQTPGEIVCVPSGWYHQVVNSPHGTTISINHNWINARALPAMVEGIATDVAYIRDAIAEHRGEMDGGEMGWSAHCQMAVGASNAGFAYPRLWKFLAFHAARLLRLCGGGGGGGGKPWEDAEAVAEGLRAVLTAWTALRADEWATVHSKLNDDLTLFEQLAAAVAALREGAGANS